MDTQNRTHPLVESLAAVSFVVGIIAFIAGTVWGITGEPFATTTVPIILVAVGGALFVFGAVYDKIVDGTWWRSR